ncbi:hypothetical protein CROQUDRAFT_133821 [Cronartium quercuum f. sp. fusiforme G11]|uniref:Uncharacterized protein n=1 Tax=Cronartium quercuum f. sp. fusiforme G11 TaxID=708437 RepID=A0A9P6NEF9_9BASI|nr:hypothetical protein CROQUDRAFT_133821 [Cronartium quercuum f. sp. fusiforme G11]
MPSRPHSSTRLPHLAKRHSSHTNIPGLGPLTTVSQIAAAEHALVNRKLSAGASQSSLLLPTVKSKTSLHKKRLSHPGKKDGSSTKLSAFGQRKRLNGPGGATVSRPAKKGAFKGALDGDGEDEEEEEDAEEEDRFQESSHLQSTAPRSRLEEEWISEPSTRCTTPTAMADPSLEPPTGASLNTQSQELDHTNLAFQLPNPLSPRFEQQLPPPVPNPQSPSPPLHGTSDQHHHSPVSDHSSRLGRQKSPAPIAASVATPNSGSEPIGRGRSRSRNRLQDSIERVQRLERSRASNENGSVSVIEGSGRRVIDPNQKPPVGTRHEQLAKRSTSPPLSISSSVTTTTARHDPKGKGVALPNRKRISGSIHSNRSFASLVNFHHDQSSTKPGLRRVDSTASVVLQPQVDPTEAFVTLTSKNKFNITLSSIEDLTPAHTPTSIPEWQAACEPGSGLAVSTEPGSGLTASTEPSSSQPSSSLIHTPLVRTGTMPGTLTSAEQAEFASRLKKLTHQVSTEPSAAGLITSLLSPRVTFKTKKQVGGAGGYFGSIKNLVGFNPTVEDHIRQADPRSSTTAASAITSSTTTQSNKIHFQPSKPKPVVKGLITSCGPVPVVSRFLGPALPTVLPNTPAPTSIMGGSRIGGCTTTTTTTTTSTNTTTTPVKAEEIRSTGSRIQQRLLMERDRPISPTNPLNNNQNHKSLPPPSYLIKSLGLQTGPLPFLPKPGPLNVNGGELNEPAMRAKFIESMKNWKLSLIDESESIWSEHESLQRWREPNLESFNRVLENRRKTRKRGGGEDFCRAFGFISPAVSYPILIKQRLKINLFEFNCFKVSHVVKYVTTVWTVTEMLQTLTIMTSTKPMKTQVSKSRNSASSNHKGSKDSSMISNRQRLNHASIKKSIENLKTIPTKEVKRKSDTILNQVELSGSSIESEKEEAGTDEKEEDSDEDEDSNSEGSEDDEMSESTFQRLVSQLGPEDMTEEELAALEQIRGANGGSGSDSDDNSENEDELKESGNSESGSEEEEEDDESVIDLEEEEDGIEYEKIRVDSDNEDLGAMVKRKVVKNDEKALLKLLDLTKEKSSLQMDFFETQTIQSTTPTQVDDINDDIGLEVELYKQALQSAKEAYTLFEKASNPFFRPDDYFAEMIKSDAHMEKIRLKLVSEMEDIQASEESKKKRNLKKFGKAIQVEKKLEREKESKRVKEGVKELRKKRKDVPSLGGSAEVDFDIALEETLSNKRARYDNNKDAKGGKNKAKLSRVGREHKFGRPKPKGVTGRRWKENTKESSSGFEGLGGRGDGKITSGISSRGRGGGRGGRGGGGGRGGKSKRPGKSMRMAKR